MGSWSVKLFSKGDQLKIKLTNLKCPENGHLDLFLLLGGFRNRKRGVSMGAKKTGEQLSLWDVGFAWMQFLMCFFDNRKAPKWRGSRIISLISEDLIPEPSQKKLPKVKNSISLIPRRPLGKSFQTPFWWSKIFLKGPCSYLRVWYCMILLIFTQTDDSTVWGSTMWPESFGWSL